MAYIQLNKINMSYDNKHRVLKDLSMDLKKGELVSLLGPSGCGKTTTLRIIAGLQEPTSGELIIDGEEYTHIPVHRRNFGMVFQSYALFPHLTVADNVAFGLKNQELSKEEIVQKVDEYLKIVGLSELKDRYPEQLSGGQRQRVALARALVIQPKLLLFDEPLSNLDAQLRVGMRNEIKRIQSESGITSVFVTHDQEECFSISDKVAIMNQGIIEQYDTPEYIYSHPKTRFVAEFIGFENFFEVVHEDSNRYLANNISLMIDQEAPVVPYEATIRPNQIQIAEETGINTVLGKVTLRIFLGEDYQYVVETPLGDLTVELPHRYAYDVGDDIILQLPADQIVLVEK